MKLFNSKLNSEIINLLKKTRQDFIFDRTGIKNRLMANLENAPIKAPSHPMPVFRFVKYASVIVTILAFLSATFAFASNSRPGDALFPLNKMGQKIVLTLPFSAEKKAKLQTQFVTNRLNDLEKINAAPSNQPNLQNIQLETIKESDEMLSNAIETISANKNRLRSNGSEKAAQQLDEVLTQLDTLASQHEDQIQEIEDQTQENDIKMTIDSHLTGIKNAHKRVHNELKHDN